MKRNTPIRFFALIVAAVTVVLLAAPAISQAQNLYVTNGETDSVGEYNATTGATINTSLISVLPNPGGLAISGNDLYVGVNGMVAEFDATTGAPIAGFTTIRGLGSGGGLGLGLGLAISGSDLYVAGSSTVGVYNAKTGAAIHASLISGLDSIGGIAISGNSLYVVNAGNDTMGEYDATTGAPIAGFTSPIQLSDPVSIAVSGNDLFVANWGISLSEYNATTGAMMNASFIPETPGLNSTTVNMVAVSGNDLYVGTAGSQVWVYDATTGAAIAGFTSPSGLYSLTSLAVSPVPEPGPWALVAGGVVLLGTMQRFRRQQPRGG